MGVRDTKTKVFMSKPEHFADAFNYLLFHGKKVIQPEKLVEIDPTEIGILLEDDSSEAVQKIRDVLKTCVVMRDDKVTYVILGIENQANVHYAMPVKTMIYDALDYNRQVKEKSDAHRIDKNLTGDEFLSGFAKDDKIKPVITLTLYFGCQEWDGPRCLSDMFEDVPDELEEFINDYQLNLIVPTEIEDFSLFTTQLRQVLQFISISTKKNELEKIAMDKSYEHLSVETVDLINEYTNANIRIEEGEKEVNMCEGLRELLADKHDEGCAEGRAEGRAQERIQMITQMLRNGKTPEQIAEFCGIDFAEVKAVADSMLAAV